MSDSLFTFKKQINIKKSKNDTNCTITLGYESFVDNKLFSLC